MHGPLITAPPHKGVKSGAAQTLEIQRRFPLCSPFGGHRVGGNVSCGRRVLTYRYMARFDRAIVEYARRTVTLMEFTSELPVIGQTGIGTTAATTTFLCIASTWYPEVPERRDARGKLRPLNISRAEERKRHRPSSIVFRTSKKYCYRSSVAREISTSAGSFIAQLFGARLAEKLHSVAKLHVDNLTSLLSFV